MLEITEPVLEVPEMIEMSDEEPRRFGRIRRVAAVLTAVATFGTGAYVLEAGADAQPVPKQAAVNAGALISFDSKDVLSDEVKLIQQARKRAEDIRQQQSLFFTAIWNNAQAQKQARKNWIPYDAAFWYRLHHCEQANTWHAGGHFGNGLPSGGNGLGMSMDAWQTAVEDAARRGITLPSTGWDASIDQQMEAAQVFWEEEGWGWACPH